MNKKAKDSPYYQDWLIKAKRDLDTAFLNHRHGGYTDTTCYFCHQVLEKVLKAYLLAKGVERLPKIHHLPTLLSLCERLSGNFSEFKTHGGILDQYYLEVKYPAGVPVDYSSKEAEQALRLAEEVFNFVIKKIETG